VIKARGDLPDVPTREALLPAHRVARYVITGVVSRQQNDGEPPGKVYTLTAWIPGDHGASNSVQVSLTFDDTREVLDFIPFLVWQLSSVFPVDTAPLPKNSLPALAEDFAWKHQWLYLGLELGGSGRFYDRDNDTRNIGMALETALRVEFQFYSYYWPLNYVSLSLLSGAALNIDRTEYRDYDSSSGVMVTTPVAFRSNSLAFPLGIKVNYKPGALALGLYGAVFYDLLFTHPPSNDLPLGCTVGLDAGFHVGPGVLYLDLHYSADLGETVFPGLSGVPDLRYKRSLFAVSLGYRFGFFQRPAPGLPKI
jgi:hypothetical protein